MRNIQTTTQDDTNKHMRELARRCQELLSDHSLNNNRKFRKQILNHIKGYIPHQLFLNDPIIIDIFQDFNYATNTTYNQTDKKIILNISIQQFSDRLKTNQNSIKRIIPYSNPLKSCKPIFIETFSPDSNDQKWTKQDYISVLQIQCEVYSVLLKQQSGIIYLLIYCQEPTEVLAKKQAIKQKYGFIIHDYAVYIINKQSFMNIRRNQINPSVYHQKKLTKIKKDSNHRSREDTMQIMQLKYEENQQRRRYCSTNHQRNQNQMRDENQMIDQNQEEMHERRFIQNHHKMYESDDDYNQDQADVEYFKKNQFVNRRAQQQQKQLRDVQHMENKQMKLKGPENQRYVNGFQYWKPTIRENLNTNHNQNKQKILKKKFKFTPIVHGFDNSALWM